MARRPLRPMLNIQKFLKRPETATGLGGKGKPGAQKVSLTPRGPYPEGYGGFVMPQEYAGSKYPGAFEAPKPSSPPLTTRPPIGKGRARTSEEIAGLQYGMADYVLGTPEAPEPLQLPQVPGGLNDAFMATQELLAAEGVTPDEVYRVIGADPSNPDGFMTMMRIRWREAMAASMGDPETAKAAFQNSIVAEIWPTDEFDEQAAWTAFEERVMGMLGDGGTAAVEEEEPAEFYLPRLDEDWYGF